MSLCEDSLKQKALDEYAVQKTDCKTWKNFKTGKNGKLVSEIVEPLADIFERVVFLWADKKEKEDKSILAKYVLELEATRGRRHKDIKKRRFEIRGKLEAWREIKKELKTNG